MVPRLSVVAAAFAAIVSCLAADIANAQGRIVARHGDWQIRCEQPVGAPEEQCALVQNVEAQDRSNVGLTVIFLQTADRQARILRVLAPLGVLLPSGLGLSIDENEIGLAGFVRCMPEGCIAEVGLEDGLIDRFRAGSTATFVIFQTPEEGIGIPISLNGFTEGFAALDNPPPPPAETDETTTAAATPRQAVATTAEPGDARATDEVAGFAAPDERTELDRLLEDELFPYVAAAAGAIVLLLGGVVWLLLRRGKRRKAPPLRSRPSPQQEYDEPDEDSEGWEDDEGDAPLPAPAGRTRRRIAPPDPGERRPPRVAAAPQTRQLQKGHEPPRLERPRPAAPRSGAPSQPRGPRRPPKGQPS